MIKRTWVIEGYKQFPIHVRRYEKADISVGVPLKHVVHILHGMSEYGGRYDAFATHLARKGYVVYIHDHRRHGKSLDQDRHPGNFINDTWNDMIRDIAAVQAFIQQTEGRYNMIMIGHSMGSFLLRDYLTQAKHPVEKAIFIGIGWKDEKKMIWGRRLIWLIEKISPNQKRPWLHRLFMGVDTQKLEWLTSDSKVITWYRQSDQCGFLYTPRFYQSCISGIMKMQEETHILKTPKIPLLIISGEMDSIGDYGDGPKRVVDTYKHLGYNAKLEMIQQEGHEVLNGLSKESVYEMIIRFIKN